LIESLGGLEILGGKPLPNGSQRGALVRLADLTRLALSNRKPLQRPSSHEILNFDDGAQAGNSPI
jgi:hypothetical protein